MIDRLIDLQSNRQLSIDNPLVHRVEPNKMRLIDWIQIGRLRSQILGSIRNSFKRNRVNKDGKVILIELQQKQSGIASN